MYSSVRACWFSRAPWLLERAWYDLSLILCWMSFLVDCALYLTFPAMLCHSILLYMWTRLSLILSYIFRTHVQSRLFLMLSLMRKYSMEGGRAWDETACLCLSWNQKSLPLHCPCGANEVWYALAVCVIFRWPCSLMRWRMSPVEPVEGWWSTLTEWK